MQAKFHERLRDYRYVSSKHD